MTFVNLCQSQTVHQENVEIALLDFSMSVQCIFFSLVKSTHDKKEPEPEFEDLRFFFTTNIIVLRFMLELL